MLFPDPNILHINTIYKPSSIAIPIRTKKNIIPTHHPLTHLPGLTIKSPVLEAIAPLPAHPIISILILVPELDSDAIIGEGEEFFAKSIAVLTVPFCS